MAIPLMEGGDRMMRQTLGCSQSVTLSIVQVYEIFLKILCPPLQAFSGSQPDEKYV